MNSFDIVQQGDEYKAVSHNFPECVGTGDNWHDSVKDMSRKIMHLKNNYPNKFRAVVINNIKKLVDAGEIPLGVCMGGSTFKKIF